MVGLPLWWGENIAGGEVIHLFQHMNAEGDIIDRNQASGIRLHSPSIYIKRYVSNVLFVPRGTNSGLSPRDKHFLHTGEGGTNISLTQEGVKHFYIEWGDKF